MPLSAAVIDEEEFSQPAHQLLHSFLAFGDVIKYHRTASLGVGIRVGDINFAVKKCRYLTDSVVEFKAAGGVFPHAADNRVFQAAKTHTARLGRLAPEDVDIEGVPQWRPSVNTTLDLAQFSGVLLIPPMGFSFRAARRRSKGMPELPASQNGNTLIRRLLPDVPPFQLGCRRKGQTSAASAPLYFFLVSFQFSFFLRIKLGRFLSFLLAFIFLTFIRHIYSSLF